MCSTTINDCYFVKIFRCSQLKMVSDMRKEVIVFTAKSSFIYSFVGISLCVVPLYKVMSQFSFCGASIGLGGSLKSNAEIWYYGSHEQKII